MWGWKPVERVVKSSKTLAAIGGELEELGFVWDARAYKSGLKRKAEAVSSGPPSNKRVKRSDSPEINLIARLEAFREAQRRSRISRALLAHATASLCRNQPTNQLCLLPPAATMQPAFPTTMITSWFPFNQQPLHQIPVPWRSQHINTTSRLSSIQP